MREIILNNLNTVRWFEKIIEVEKIRAKFLPEHHWYVTLNMKLNFETELGRDTVGRFESKMYICHRKIWKYHVYKCMYLNSTLYYIYSVYSDAMNDNAIAKSGMKVNKSYAIVPFWLSIDLCMRRVNQLIHFVKGWARSAAAEM